MKWIVLLLSLVVFAVALWFYNTPGLIGLAVALQLFHSSLFATFLWMDYRERWPRIVKKNLE